MVTFQNAKGDEEQNGAEGHDATITEVLDAYARGGFASSFVVTQESSLECVACGVVSFPANVSMSSLRRLEGPSDPDDMVAVVAVTCPTCRAQASVVLGFGPMASLQDAEVLKNLRDDRGDEMAPGNSAHGETTGDETTPSVAYDRDEG